MRKYPSEHLHEGLRNLANHAHEQDMESPHIVCNPDDLGPFPVSDGERQVWTIDDIPVLPLAIVPKGQMVVMTEEVFQVLLDETKRIVGEMKGTQTDGKEAQADL